MIYWCVICGTDCEYVFTYHSNFRLFYYQLKFSRTLTLCSFPLSFSLSFSRFCYLLLRLIFFPTLLHLSPLLSLSSPFPNPLIFPPLSPPIPPVHLSSHSSIASSLPGVKTVLPAARTTDDDALSPIEALLGISSVLAMVAISGYSAIYFEAML